MTILLLGLAVGVLIGLMGVGGGVVIVPVLVHLLNMTQHQAQGTSLLMQLPPIGLGALYLYWKKENVDLRAGIVCALGFLLGGYFGSVVAIGIASAELKRLFGGFLMAAALLMLRQAGSETEANKNNG